MRYGTIDNIRWWYELENRHGTVASGSFLVRRDRSTLLICEEILAAAGGRSNPVRDDDVAEWQEDNLRHGG